VCAHGRAEAYILRAFRIPPAPCVLPSQQGTRVCPQTSSQASFPQTSMARCQVQDPERTRIRYGQSYELRVAPRSVEYFKSSRAVGSKHDALSGEVLDRGDNQRVR